MRRLSFALSFVLAASAVACTADSSEDDLGAEEGEKRIKPKDSEALGRIQVTWPQGWQAPVNPNEDAQASYRGARVVIGEQLRLKDGTGCVGLTSKFTVQLSECGIDLQKNKTTKFELAALKLGYDLGPTGKLHSDFGPKPSLNIWRKMTNAQGAQEEQSIGTAAHTTGAFAAGNVTNQRGVITMPGEYRFSWSLPILDEKKETLAKGKVETVDLNPADKRATIRVKAPTRELPNATFTCSGANRNFIVQRSIENTAGFGEPDGYSQRRATEGSTPGYNANEGIVAWRSLPLTQDTEMKVFPFAPAEGAMHYEYVVNGISIPLDVKPGKVVNVEIDRLDVDHVEVEKEDGTTYAVQGTYRVFRQGANGAWLPITQRTSQYGDCSGYASATEWRMATGTGLDLPYGTYRVVIDYTTAEGAKQKDETITLP